MSAARAMRSIGQHLHIFSSSRPTFPYALAGALACTAIGMLLSEVVRTRLDGYRAIWRQRGPSADTQTPSRLSWHQIKLHHSC